VSLVKKVIIIGGGIAGLSAGIYAQKAGFQSVIYEKHTIFGGECTGWDRKGFHIDGCIDWLTGTKPGTDLYDLWVEVGALENVEIYQPDSFATYEYEGKKVNLWRDLDEFKAELLKISPEDKPEIKKLCKYIERYFNFQIPCKKPLDLMGILDKIKLGISMKDIGFIMNKLEKITISEYLSRFKNPIIREVLNIGVHQNYCAYILPFTYATVMSGNGGRPKGGSKAMAQRMEEKYRSLGGEVELGQEVEEIIIEKDLAKGVLLSDGRMVYGDYIVPTCDTNITFHKLLKDKYQDEEFIKKYENEKAYPLFTCVYVSLGVDADLSDYSSDLVFQTSQFPFEDGSLNQISIKHYCYEPSFAPESKSVLTSYINANYDWWKEKKQNIEEYKAEKVKLGINIIERIEEHFPELQGKITLLDVATPLTFERYCGAYKGSYMSFGTTPEGKQMLHDGKIKDIKNLYMGGQWLMPPGGLPAALVTGKWAIQKICHAEGKIK